MAVIIASSGLTTTTSSSSRLRRQTDVQQRHDSRFPRYTPHATAIPSSAVRLECERTEDPRSQHRILFHSAASRRRLRPRPRPSPSLVRQTIDASTTTLFDDLTICNERYHIALVQTCERDLRLRPSSCNDRHTKPYSIDLTQDYIPEYNHTAEFKLYWKYWIYTPALTLQTRDVTTLC